MAATVGCILCGVVLSLSLYCFFRRHRESVYVFQVLSGLKAASLGLIVFAGSLFALRKWKVNPILLMVITGALGVLLY